ncbi:MAG TPA: hypothetical protein VG498_10045 [Terriglobales bacterium]|nr:hypothetical protein [Terriglobales bacterium]
MKKKSGSRDRTDQDGSGTSVHSRRQIKDAIERVFRLTHQREMTIDERRIFGIGERPGVDSQDVASTNGTAAKRVKVRSGRL